MKKSGFGGLIALVLILALLMWGLTILLYVLAVAIPLVAVLFGGLLIVHGWQEVRRRREIAGIEEEIAHMAAESAAQLDDLSARWDYAMYTKGIGTPLQAEVFAQNGEAQKFRERLSSARALLTAAPSTPYRIEAIIGAERTRSQLRPYLA